ncbi:MAG: glycosyltransferase family 2 protein [Candidatus Hermodarchaeota archaeon]
MNLKRKSVSQYINQDSYTSKHFGHKDHIKSSFSYSNLILSIIMPLFNEQNSIKHVIEKIPKNCNHEILIVDDGSTDNSIEEIKKINGKFIKIIKHGKNRGYGAALLTGFKHSNGDIIVTLDSDGQHCPEEIPRLLKPIINKKADLAIGSRYLGKIHYPVPLHIKFGEYFIRKFLKLLYNKEIANNQSGFRAFHRSLLTHFKGFYDCEMAFSTELLLKTLELNKKIIEIPISLKPRKYGKSYVKLVKILINILKCFFIYGLRKNRILKKFSDKYLDFLLKNKNI